MLAKKWQFNEALNWMIMLYIILILTVWSNLTGKFNFNENTYTLKWYVAHLKFQNKKSNVRRT